jgi:hypothetical protein
LHAIRIKFTPQRYEFKNRILRSVFPMKIVLLGL